MLVPEFGLAVVIPTSGSVGVDTRIHQVRGIVGETCLLGTMEHLLHVAGHHSNESGIEQGTGGEGQSASAQWEKGRRAIPVNTRVYTCDGWAHFFGECFSEAHGSATEWYEWQGRRENLAIWRPTLFCGATTATLQLMNLIPRSSGRS